jgi:hypothetical protein
MFAAPAANLQQNLSFKLKRPVRQAGGIDRPTSSMQYH